MDNKNDNNNLLNSLNNINNCLERIISSCQNSYLQQSTTQTIKQDSKLLKNNSNDDEL
jgi:hypothetical protein